jgi:hypothetical protein
LERKWELEWLVGTNPSLGKKGFQFFGVNVGYVGFALFFHKILEALDLKKIVDDHRLL